MVLALKLPLGHVFGTMGCLPQLFRIEGAKLSKKYYKHIQKYLLQNSSIHVIYFKDRLFRLTLLQSYQPSLSPSKFQHIIIHYWYQN